MSSKAKQYLVFGIGRFGSALCRALSEMGHEVLAVDESGDHIRAISPYVTQALELDATDEEAIRTLGVRNFDAVVVSIGDNVKNSIMVTLLCKELGAKYLLAKATDELHAKMLTKMGADRVVFPERDMGLRVAKSLVSPHVVDLINLTGDYTIADITAPSAWWDRSIADIDIRKNYNVSVLLIHRGNELLMNAPPDTRIERGDDLLLLGHRNDVDRVEKID